MIQEFIKTLFILLPIFHCAPFYTHQSCSNPFNDISGSGTLWAANDDTTTEVSIFSFNFYGFDYSDVLLGSNGFMSFDLGIEDIPWSPEDIPDITRPNNWILMYQEDLAPGYNINGNETVVYETQGDAPNRQFIFQFTNIPEAPNIGANTFQAILNETTNIIQLRYGSINAYDTGRHGDVPSIGIENKYGDEGISIDASTVSDGTCIEFNPHNECVTDEDCPTGLICCPAKKICHPPVIDPSADQYFLSVNAMTWDEGKTYCTGLGANFSSIHSYIDLLDIRYLCASSGADACHIGMYLDVNSNKWLWSDGSDSDYGFNPDGSPDGNIQPPWESGYAYDGIQYEKCQKMDIGDGGYFDDGDCNADFPVICYGVPPSSAKAIGGLSDLGENIKYNYNNIKHQPDYKNNNNYYYGYILLIGFIAFILINNVFIGCWCVRKKGQSDLKYEKCEVEVVNQ